MSAPPLSPVAKQGDRISHDTGTASRSTDTLVAALLGHALVMRGNGGALLAQVGAGASCKSGGKSSLSITELIPHSTTGTIEKASPTVFVAPGAGAALSEADPVDCHHHRDKPIEPGSTSIQVQGLFLARSGAQTGCGAIVCDGAPTVLAGGPAASGAGSGAQGGSPVLDAINYVGNVLGQVSAAVASVEKGAAMIEGEIKDVLHEVQGTVHGACAAVTGALASVTKGGVLGALFGQKSS
ncbi:MAG: PAAR domain-containing protein [Polyangiaceae bacterium]